MDVDDLFKVLKPVLGNRARALWIEYWLHPESRRDIEALMRVLASQHLGEDFDRRHVLLAPPPQRLADGEYPLGTVVYGNRELYPFALRENEWIQHLGIYGRTGSGKTNVGLLIVKQLLEKRKPFLIFDWKRNYRDMLKWPEAREIRLFTVGREVVPFRFNPLIPPPGTKPSIWLKKLIEILMHVYWLGEGVAYLLQKAIDAVYLARGVYQGNSDAATLRDVQSWLLAYKAKGREAQWMDSTLRVVGTLCYGDIGDVVNVETQTPLEELLRQNVILELDALTNSDKTFLIETLLLWIHHYRLQQEQREKFKHAIMIEEAHHILLRRKESKESVPDVILREIRELGESIILIDQHPSLISVPALGNTYTTIAMNLKHARDVAAASDAMLIDRRDREYLGLLDVGTGIVKLQGRHFKPFLVRFPLVELEKGSVSDEWLRTRFRGDSESNEEIPAQGGMKDDIPPIPAAGKEAAAKEEELGENEKRMLEDVIEHATSGVAARFTRLSLGVGRGSRLVKRVIANGLLSSAMISTGKGRVRFLQLTDKGAAAFRAMGYTVKLGRRGSPAHEYWKLRLADYYRARGYDVELEKAIGDGKTVDLIAAKDVGHIAIEVETGKSDAVANASKCLAAGFEKVICFDVFGGVERELEQNFADDLLTSRVHVMKSSDLS